MNVLDRVREALDLANRAKEALSAVTSTIADGREAIDTKRLDQMQELLKKEKLETQAAADDLAKAIADYRKARG
jgi:hypothetical protein